MAVTDQLDLSAAPSEPLRDYILAHAISIEVFIHLERIDEADEVYD
ncbi:hypothetical protein PN498_26865 [Oscillatoria sp. CS-180]|nr:hypothetical protein [Oscillatoria sp. CS-180]MDB9529640.1 hypothetical protein [Oscillatoria sp. CS-180]